jgi:hypothetical protein
MITALGAYALRNMVADVANLVSQLPTRMVEDTSQARKSNRRSALWEFGILLAIRALPGLALVVAGICLLGFLSAKIMTWPC